MATFISSEAQKKTWMDKRTKLIMSDVELSIKRKRNKKYLSEISIFYLMKHERLTDVKNDKLDTHRSLTG